MRADLLSQAAKKDRMKRTEKFGGKFMEGIKIPDEVYKVPSAAKASGSVPKVEFEVKTMLGSAKKMKEMENDKDDVDETMELAGSINKEGRGIESKDVEKYIEIIKRRKKK